MKDLQDQVEKYIDTLNDIIEKFQQTMNIENKLKVHLNQDYTINHKK